jgi:transcriptional regulator GlxA family with amidase domain
MNIIHKALFVVFILFLGCSQQNDRKIVQAASADYPTQWLNVGLVIVDGVYNSELIAPMDVFHHSTFHTEPAMKVFTVAPDTTVVTSFEGLRMLPDYSFASPDLPSIDILVVPSAENSMGSDLQNEELISFVSSKGRDAKYVISLCDGAFVLARAGLVSGRKSTTFPTDIEAYKQRFPELDVISDVSFVHDGKLITSAGGAKSYDPALYLCELLYGREVALGIAGGLVIDWDLELIDHLVVSP